MDYEQIRRFMVNDLIEVIPPNFNSYLHHNRAHYSGTNGNHDEQLGTEVALKTLKLSSGTDLYRFKREFRSLADTHQRPSQQERPESARQGGRVTDLVKGRIRDTKSPKPPPPPTRPCWPCAACWPTSSTPSRPLASW